MRSELIKILKTVDTTHHVRYRLLISLKKLIYRLNTYKIVMVCTKLLCRFKKFYMIGIQENAHSINSQKRLLLYNVKSDFLQTTNTCKVMSFC